jgi:hypothetical protein
MTCAAAGTNCGHHVAALRPAPALTGRCELNASWPGPSPSTSCRLSSSAERASVAHSSTRSGVRGCTVTEAPSARASLRAASQTRAASGNSGGPSATALTSLRYNDSVIWDLPAVQRRPSSVPGPAAAKRRTSYTLNSRRLPHRAAHRSWEDRCPRPTRIALAVLVIWLLGFRSAQREQRTAGAAGTAGRGLADNHAIRPRPYDRHPDGAMTAVPMRPGTAGWRNAAGSY